MIHDITIKVKDTHHTANNTTEQSNIQTIANAIDVIDVCIDAIRNVSLLYTYDISCGYYVERLEYSNNSAYMVCKSYVDKSDYHVLTANAENAAQKGKIKR